MKKLITLLLVLTGMVSTASADNFIKGTWDNWTTASKFSFEGGIGSVTLNLSPGVYRFKFIDGETWMGCAGTMTYSNCTDWAFSSGTNDDCYIEAPVAGDYIFSVTWSDSTPKVSVSYPSGTVTVYFYNNLTNWTSTPYAYILGNAYWDSYNNPSKGSGSQGATEIEMSRIGGTNIWKAEYTLNSPTAYIAFVKDRQTNYNNFYNTEAVYRYDFNASTPLYVPNTTTSGTYNGTTYFSNGEWHAYPTYTRSVTSSNFGTICLPFAASVTGATIYKISGKVMEDDALKGINLEKVEELEAGKPYIFKATGETLTATLSGEFTPAIAANGMMGNIGSSITVTPDAGNYVIGGDNLIHAVVSESGNSNVTVGQYKAYITLAGVDVAASREANFIAFEDGGATGISQIENGELNNESYFDLQGRRVAQPTKGLYIVNGKKVIIK